MSREERRETELSPDEALCYEAHVRVRGRSRADLAELVRLVLPLLGEQVYQVELVIAGASGSLEVFDPPAAGAGAETGHKGGSLTVSPFVHYPVVQSDPAAESSFAVESNPADQY